MRKILTCTIVFHLAFRTRIWLKEHSLTQTSPHIPIPAETRPCKNPHPFIHSTIASVTHLPHARSTKKIKEKKRVGFTEDISIQGMAVQAGFPLHPEIQKKMEMVSTIRTSRVTRHAPRTPAPIPRQNPRPGERKSTLR